jgi:hypothetical protein
MRELTFEEMDLVAGGELSGWQWFWIGGAITVGVAALSGLAIPAAVVVLEAAAIAKAIEMHQEMDAQGRCPICC